LFDGREDVDSLAEVQGIPVVFPERSDRFAPDADILFDLPANAFYFLSSWSERLDAGRDSTRRLYRGSAYARLGAPQDIVDQYLERLVASLDALCARLSLAPWSRLEWPHGARYAVVLSHDVDFLPTGLFDSAKQGVKTVLRHLIRQRDPVDAIRAGSGLLRALVQGRDPYGCIPEIIERESELGVRASFQVAVAHRHPSDVNYSVEDDRVRDYLSVITRRGFDLCLHGSYRSTEDPKWYVAESRLLTQRLGKPLGSRQHYLSFDYDNLFRAQEEAGICFDMSMGFPDRPGPRAGFSYPYFPFCLSENRPYDVLQISLFLMDVTLRSYLGLKGERAWHIIEEVLGRLRDKRGCASVVWHPIVFGGARDPGFDRLFWDMVDYVLRTAGMATDGRTINSFWRGLARHYPSFVAGGAEVRLSHSEER
jgi:hypothetical protein